jgi:hypothetical protein
MKRCAMPGNGYNEVSNDGFSVNTDRDLRFQNVVKGPNLCSQSPPDWQIKGGCFYQIYLC